jgi:16S rRNA (guanine966-N2)-methyltransferase
MRVIGGKLKGRVLKGPSSDAIRPTSDRLRETIFDIIMHSFADAIINAKVIDVFAGTGAIAIEALSRGASAATLVDDSAKACALIRQNLAALDLGGMGRLIRRDARKLGASPDGELYDFVFLDPPYGKGLIEPSLIALREGRWLKPGTLIVMEEATTQEIRLPSGFLAIKTRVFSDTKITFASFA